MKNKKVLLSLLLIICITCAFTIFAHQGNTDGNGGHRDNNNVSGLGSYHYHCGGYPAHLHSNGYCPYTSAGYSSSSYTSSSDDYDDRYDAGYEDGYDEGHRVGYDEGYDDGSYEGYNEGYEKGYKDRIEEAAAEREKELNLLMILTLTVVSIVLLVKFIKRHRKG